MEKKKKEKSLQRTPGKKKVHLILIEMTDLKTFVFSRCWQECVLLVILQLLGKLDIDIRILKNNLTFFSFDF